MLKSMIHLSTRKRPLAKQVKDLYATAPWAWDRDIRKISLALKNSSLLVTAWRGSKLVGMARCSSDFVFRCVLWDVIVDPEYQGKGLGEKMMKHILNHPRLKSVDQFWLYSSANEKFYQTLGFRRQTRGVMIHRKGNV